MISSNHCHFYFHYTLGQTSSQNVQLSDLFSVTVTKHHFYLGASSLQSVFKTYAVEPEMASYKNCQYTMCEPFFSNGSTSDNTNATILCVYPVMNSA